MVRFDISSLNSVFIRLFALILTFTLFTSTQEIPLTTLTPQIFHSLAPTVSQYFNLSLKILLSTNPKLIVDDSPPWGDSAAFSFVLIKDPIREAYFFQLHDSVLANIIFSVVFNSVDFFLVVDIFVGFSKALHTLDSLILLVLRVN